MPGTAVKRRVIPELWNGNNNQLNGWSLERSLPENWGNSGDLNNVWDNSLSLPAGWSDGRELPGDRGAFSSGGVASPAKSNKKRGSGLSDVARSNAGKLANAARKAGKTAKNAVDSAVQYAKSDEFKDKAGAARNKARSLADDAGNALSGMKDSAERLINERAQTDAADLLSDEIEDNAVIADVSADDTAYDMEYSEDDGYEEYIPDEDAEEEYEDTDESYDETPYYQSGEETVGRAENVSAPVYETPYAETGNVYVTEKRSPVIYVLLGIIGVLISGVGLLGGMLLMRNKDGNNNISSSKNSTAETPVKADDSDTDNAVEKTDAAQEAAPAEDAAVPASQRTVKQFSAGDISKYPQYTGYIKDNLSQSGSGVTYKGLYKVSDVGYALYDINGDNIPELIIQAGLIDIYSIDNGELVGLTPFWGGNMVRDINIHENGYVSMTSLSGNGEGGTTYFEYNGGNEMDTIASESFNLNTSEESYSYNGQTVEKGTFGKVIGTIGDQLSVKTSPLTDIPDVKSYIEQKSAPKYTNYDPSAAGSDFTFSSDKTEYKVNTESDSLNLRSAPSTNSEVIVQMPKNSSVYEYGHNSEWSYVCYTTGGTTYYGYASRKYLGTSSVTAASTPSAASGSIQCKVNIDSGTLNLRSEPSMSGEVILQLPKDAIVYEYSHDHVWSYISYTTGGKTYYGYANKQYILDVNEKVVVTACNKKGTINASNGEVAGFAGSYVVDGGTSQLVRKSLDHGWHVTAVNYCYSKGILWYELYDTDDNDYYGWVDAGFINFY